VEKAPMTSSAVARRAGVSRTTVSFVLNGVLDKGISEQTRRRVLAAAQELGYAPNAAARTLAGGATGTVAVVIPRAAHLYVDAFLAQLVASINEQCHLNGLKLLIESTEDGQREPGHFLQLVRSRSIDGLIVAHLRTSEHEHLRRLRDQGIPLVVLGCGLPDTERYCTIGDNTWMSATLAVNHLLGLGHRQIAFVNYASPEYHSVSNRERGWRHALAERGVAIDPAWVSYADISPQSGYVATRELLSRRVKFSALFAGNDTIAFGALRALDEAGMRVPHDVAVVGYDDIPLAAFASPPLTTMRSDPAGQGKQAVQALLSQMNRKTPGTQMHEERPASLVIRESCGATQGIGNPTAPGGA
jgi:DNA-binding LacI/PurR family transcriptional regulator